MSSFTDILAQFKVVLKRRSIDFYFRMDCCTYADSRPFILWIMPAARGAD